MGEKLSFGSGALKKIEKMDGDRVFIVTGGKSVFANGTMDKIEASLKAGSKSFHLLSGIKANPDTQAVLEGVAQMQAFKPDVILAVGGGSPIDAAKVMALFYEYPELNFDLDFGSYALPDKRKSLKFVAVPTTSGTGTEVTKAAVITFNEKNIKIGLKSQAFVPDWAILDSDLTISMPSHIAAQTGLDALTHAVECYTNHNLDDFTEPLAYSAIEGILKYLPESCEKNTPESREKVHYYQCIAGMAFTNVGLGMAHGIAHAFGGRYDFGHGLLNGTLLPYVMTFNSRDAVVKQKLETISRRLGVDSVIDEIKKLNERVGIPSGFEGIGLDRKTFEKDLEMLVEDSMKGSTRGNPVKITKEEMRLFLREMMEG
jgi:hypothetical protein